MSVFVVLFIDYLPLQVRDSSGGAELRHHAARVHPARTARQNHPALGAFQRLLQLRGNVNVRHRF